LRVYRLDVREALSAYARYQPGGNERIQHHLLSFLTPTSFLNDCLPFGVVPPTGSRKSDHYVARVYLRRNEIVNPNPKAARLCEPLRTRSLCKPLKYKLLNESRKVQRGNVHRQSLRPHGTLPC
jgi:hypothetical protein